MSEGVFNLVDGAVERLANGPGGPSTSPFLSQIWGEDEGRGPVFPPHTQDGEHRWVLFWPRRTRWDKIEPTTGF
jgi:hypothetical protein